MSSKSNLILFSGIAIAGYLAYTEYMKTQKPSSQPTAPVMDLTPTISKKQSPCVNKYDEFGNVKGGYAFAVYEPHCSKFG